MGRKPRRRLDTVVQDQKTLMLGQQLCQRRDNKLSPWYDVAPVIQSVKFGSGNLSSNRYYRRIRLCDDEIHWPGPPYKTGGPLNIVRGYDGLSSPHFLTSGRWFLEPKYQVSRYSYAGLWIPYWTPPVGQVMSKTITVDSPNFTQLGDISSYGPQAMSRFSPVKPQVDLGQFIAEIVETPRMLRSSADKFRGAYSAWRHRSKTMTRKRFIRGANAVGDETLNVMFGWLPFLSTIIAYHRTCRNLHNIVKRLRKYNGQWQKRGGPVVEVESESYVTGSGVTSLTYPVLISTLNRGAMHTVTKRVVKDIWFEGRCKYYVPELESPSFWPQKVLRQIYGLNITPELLWNLTPWSWLADWGSSVGDTLANWSDHHDFNLVWDRAYIMGTSRIEYEFEAQRMCGTNLNIAKWTYDLERKQRVKAHPYGVGIPFDGLNSYQLTILSALGLSRLRA